jgi:predicted O-linked N-acetylglucosamine transferase (SPINDLY family)
MERFDRCLRIDNRHQESRFARAMLLRKVGRLSEAAEGLSSIVETDPTNAQAHAGLAALYKDEGKIEEALAHGRRAVELDPGNAEFHGNLIMNMHYSDCVTPSELFEAHRAWGLAHAPTGVAPVQRIEPCDPEMPLRIGYVSPDFRRHSVAYFISSILANHDRSRHTVFCYSNLVPDRTDAMTTLLRGRADVWREIATMSDQYAAEMIGADGIDILVDLAGHSAGNRLGVFALRAAPVQITWLGYPGTTGMVDMDYRLTDLIADPAPEADRFCTEHLIRIPNGFLCYEPAQDAPNPGPLPHDRNGYVTFGSFNNLAKVNDALLVAWGTILKTVPRSRLVLKSIALADDNVCKHLLRRFGALGVDTGRVELVSWQPKTTAHLGLYQQIDIALDTFPYNGTTTTCEALWMGVPAITLQGETHANRVGASLLSHVGLPELVADTSQQYIEFATALACDVDRLRLLRATLRDRLRGASLLDCRGFTYRLEQCYRHVWRHYCDEQPD